MSILQKAQLLVHTLRHLKPSQFLYRLKRLQRTHLLRGTAYPMPSSVEFGSEIQRVLPFEAASIPAAAVGLVDGEFTFIGLPAVSMEQIGWRDAPHNDLLWLFNLHYFEWGVELARAWRASGDERFARRALDVIEDWIEHNPFPEGPGWHPYPTSRRLVSWAVILGAVSDWLAGRAHRVAKILASIDQQVDYLADWPEKELEGNHLLANYHALAWVSLHLGEQLRPETRSKIARFVDEFWREFMRQTKPDGSHEENSTSYQMVVLQDALTLLVLSESQGRPVPASARRRIETMFGWLVSVMMPVSERSERFIEPLLNDSVRGYPVEARRLIALGAAYFEEPRWKYVAGNAGRDDVRWWLGEEGLDAYEEIEARPPEATSYAHRDSGYFVIRGGWASDSDYLLFDCGPIGPDHIPGHAHADTLSVIICARGQQLLVDPGVYTYRAGDDRNYFRSTRAHSTVVVDGEDQSEVWAAFRVARRARADLEEWEADERVAGRHDGYMRLPGRVLHRREVSYMGAGGWQICDELVSEGGRHVYEAGFQLAPSVTLEMLDDRAAEVMLVDGSRVTFSFEGSAGWVLAREDGWHSATWNRREPCDRVVARLASRSRNVRLRTTIIVRSSQADEA